jgi:isopentenyl diphosphate isomerase/L-lactate dehydrogenase-like FMN-dependent dehydrogenase
MNPTAWNYYSSGADDEVTMRENHAAFHRIWFRPRVLVNVKQIDLRTTIMGYPSALPIYITSCALGRLAHPDGECVLTRAAHTAGVIQMCPTLASCTLDEMLEASHASQTLFFQLYVNHDRAVTSRLIQKAKAGGVKAVAITVDAPQLGRREKDMRGKFDLAGSNVQQTDDSAGKVSWYNQFDHFCASRACLKAALSPSCKHVDIDRGALYPSGTHESRAHRPPLSMVHYRSIGRKGQPAQSLLSSTRVCAGQTLSGSRKSATP